MITSKNRKLLEKAALVCPVGNSLRQDVIQNIRFNYVWLVNLLWQNRVCN